MKGSTARAWARYSFLRCQRAAMVGTCACRRPVALPMSVEERKALDELEAAMASEAVEVETVVEASGHWFERIETD